MKNGNNLNKFYAELIKEARIKSGMTQNQIAIKTQLNQEMISRMERGKSKIALPDFVRVMSAINPHFIKAIVPTWWFKDILCKCWPDLAMIFQSQKNHLLFTKLIGPISASHYSDEEQFLRQGRHHISRANTHRHHIITHETKPQYDPGGHCKVFESEPELYILDRVRPSFTIN